MQRRRFILLAGGLTLLPVAANAEPVRWHLSLEGAHTLIAPQQQEYDWGGGVAVALEVPVATSVGIEGQLGGIYLADGRAPTMPGLANHGPGSAGSGMVGIRLRPFAASGPGGFWVAGHGGYVRTGTENAPIFDIRAGYDIRALSGGRLDLGPVFGFTQIIELGNQLRPQDAHIASIGLQISLGAPRPERPDRDGDGVFDDEDVCPDEPGLRTNDPTTNGCPRRDSDNDTVYDDEDACPTVAGIRTNNPKTNGCPRPDRDGDSIFDDEDACPTVPGVRTNNPKTNGCPHSDRDLDGVFDDEDACPDIPGPRTSDPKTNGCPKAVGAIHVVEDRIEYDERIHFGFDVAAVKPESYPVVQRLAQFITGTPNITEVEIIGHTDEIGPSDYNLRLSELRAQAVKALLVKYGVTEDHLVTQGFGEKSPRIEGHTASAYRENRRVEFFITRVRNASGNETRLSSPVPMEQK